MDFVNYSASPDLGLLFLLEAGSQFFAVGGGSTLRG